MKLRRLCSILILCLVGFACEKEEPMLDTRPLAIETFEELFDEDGHIKVTASFGTLNPDTIESYGVVFTDAQSDFGNLNLDLHHFVDFTDLQSIKTGARGRYAFDALINPKRESPQYSAYQVFMAAFIKSKRGTITLSPPEVLTADKLKIIDVFPINAAPGSVMEILLNRDISNKKIKSYSGVSPGSEHSVLVKIGAQNVVIDSTRSKSIFVTMPANISDAPIQCEVGSYKHNYAKRASNKLRGFTYLTKANLMGAGDNFMFTRPGAIYIGGGRTSDGKVQPEFRKYNLNTKAWTPIADFPMTGHVRGMAFTIGTKTYCGVPENMYAYDDVANEWSKVLAPTNSLKDNHTFSGSSYAVHDGKAYFTNFSNKVVGGMYWKNFWQFNPATQKYDGLTDYPGTTISSQYSTMLDQAVALGNELHFFRNLQHWTYNTTTSEWRQLNNVQPDGHYAKGFNYKGELYAIAYRIYPGAFLGSTGAQLSLYKYDKQSDAWIKDSDVPRMIAHSEYNSLASSFYILQTSEDEVFLVTSSQSVYSIYRIF